MRRLIGYGSAVVFACLGLLSACSSGGPESTVDEGTAASAATGSGQSGANANTGGISLGGSSSNNSGSGGTGGDGPIEECAAANQQAELKPVYLVFLLDESGSMGDGRNGNRAEKWDPVTQALNAFFADAQSAGITASLSIFPLNNNKTQGAADEDIAPDCQASAYVAPVVQPTALPNSTAFADAIMALDPPNEYGTPTLPALSGTIDYAKSVLAEDPTRKVAIVMVTDGDPNRCQGNNVANTAAAAATVADQIPTYVIGVGKSLTSLNDIAIGGGTKKAFVVSSDGMGQTPEKTRQDLLDAVNLIRGQAISCEIDIPTPPVGKKLDPEKVDVQFTSDGKPASSLKYGTECTGDAAWRYDDAMAPTKIELCADACSAVKADAKGKLDVVFGCVKRDVVN
jgi:Mg-chelatase subunit ChlD